MFDWLRKKPEPQPESVPATGFFSTDLDVPKLTKEGFADLVKRSIRRTQANFAPVTEAGAAVEGVGMDESDSDFAKMDGDISAFFPSTQLGWYASQGFIGYQMCAIIAQNWLVNKACLLPGRDAMRHGYEITVNDGTEIAPEVIDKIKAADKRYKIKKHAVEMIHLGRVFGVRHVLPIIDYGSPEATEDAWKKPFNIDGVKPGSYKGLCQIDPYWITPELDQQAAANPASLHFYEPTWWRVNGKRIHRSHLIIFRNGEVPDILKPTYYYGGVPLPQKIAERVYAAERTANEAPMLSLSKRTNIVHCDVEAALANPREFDSRMKLAADLQNNYGTRVLGKEETAEQFDTSLADFDSLIMTQYQLVAAIADVISTKLLETSPKGFNATGEFEMNSYHESLESIQENDIDPLVERHHLLMMKSDFPEVTSQIVHNWNPVAPLDPKTQAEINQIKATTGSTLSSIGAIDGVDERARIIADKDSGYTGIADRVPEMPGDEDDAGAEDGPDKSVSKED